MHEPIKSNLEDYLNGCKEKIPPEFEGHLTGCETCANELRLFESQSALLRSLRPGEEIEPRPGFYARVMDRIEEQTRISIWAVFLQPRFGRRLAVASAILVLLLGTYLLTTEPIGQSVAPIPAAAVTNSSPQQDVVIPLDTPEQRQQRDAVLVDLASFHE